MRISVFYEHIREACEQTGQDMATMLRFVKNCGYDGVEMNLTCLLQDKRRITAALKKADLRVSAIYEFYDWGRCRDSQKEKRHLALARKLGVKRILIVPGFLDKEEAYVMRSLAGNPEKLYAFFDGSEAVRGMLEGLRDMVSKAGDIAVSLEDFDGDTAPYATADGLLYFMERVPGLQFTMDCGNFAFSDEDALIGYEKLKRYVVHVHCKDRDEEPEKEELRGNAWNKGLKAVAAGAGYMPIAAVLKDLRGNGYDGWLAAEHFGAPDQRTFMEQSAEYIRTVWEKNE